MKQKQAENGSFWILTTPGTIPDFEKSSWKGNSWLERRGIDQANC
jgi:hypothetical protein